MSSNGSDEEADELFPAAEIENDPDESLADVHPLSEDATLEENQDDTDPEWKLSDEEAEMDDDGDITELRPLKHVDRTCKLSSKKVNRACVTRCRDAERCQSLKSRVYINVESIVPEICLRSLDLFIA